MTLCVPKKKRRMTMANIETIPFYYFGGRMDSQLANHSQVVDDHDDQSRKKMNQLTTTDLINYLPEFAPKSELISVNTHTPGGYQWNYTFAC